jgi:tRNA (adenine57-N1/adenine58-N1)-methyltransferase
MINTALLVSVKHGSRKEFLVKSEGELHTDKGIINLDTLKELEYGDIILTHMGYEFRVLKPRNPDFFHHFKRTGAPMMPHDIGAILAHTGLNKDDVVLDAGTGSGITAIFLGAIAKKVITYEINPEFAKKAAKNIERAGLKNVEVVVGNVLDISIEGRFDVVTLDLLEARKAAEVLSELVVPGGFIVSYSPFFEQALNVRKSLQNLSDIKTLEVIEREIEVSNRGTRPSTRVGHTGFITIARL